MNALVSEVRRWSMIDRCTWPRGCWQDQAYESGDYCTYHLKLVEGLIDFRGTTRRKDRALAAGDLWDAGAVPGAIARMSETDEPIPYDRGARKRFGKMPRGTVRLSKRRTT